MVVWHTLCHQRDELTSQASRQAGVVGSSKYEEGVREHTSGEF